MATRLLPRLLCLCALALTFLAVPLAARSAAIVAAYYGSTPGTTSLSSLVSSGAAYRLTHLIYAFAASDASNPCLSAPTLSTSDLQSLKTLKSAGVKILISLGGENSGSEFQTAMSENPNFASTCVASLMADTPNGGFQFDGIDIDWETPGNTTDEQNFNVLLGAFRTAFNDYQQSKGLTEHLLLTAAITPEYTALGWQYIDFSGQSYPPGAASSVDFFNVEFYGYAYQGDGITESDAPLYEINADLYGNASIYGASKGIITDGKVPPAKIVVGIPFYGVHYTGVTAGQTLGQSGSLEYTAAGVVDYPYYQLMRQTGVAYNDGDGKTGCTLSPVPLTCDGIGGAAWIWNSSTETLWAFDNPETVGTKGRYARAQGLGGVMTWNLMYDTPSGTMLTALASGVSSAAPSILWQNSNGAVVRWFVSGGKVTSSANLGSVPGWSVQGTGDFNGVGHSDILWRNSTSGDVVVWFMDGGTHTSSADLGVIPLSWTVAGIGDFNGDGKSDILWRNSNGDVVIWFMNGGTVNSSTDLGVVPANWTIAGTEDFNSDGKSDILWRNTASGDVDIWFMAGQTIASSKDIGAIAINSNWSIQGTGIDGKPFILWRNTSSGDVVIWLLNSSGTLDSSTDLGAVDLGWKIAGSEDFNNDGQTDILWRNANGDVVIWNLNAGSLSSSADLGVVDNSWSIAP